MSTQPLVSIRYRALDANGKPLAGGKLYSYAAGTSTPQPTYTTRAATIANANPVVLDANGEADIWLSSALGADYKFVLKDSSGVIQNTVDNWPVTADTSITSGGGGSTDAAAIEPGGRLTLASASPVTAAELSGITAVYYSPFKSDKIPLFDGTSWALYSTANAFLSQSLVDNTKSPAAAVADHNYDMFIWNDSGTLRLSRGPPWSGDNARGTGAGTTELVQANGRCVNANSITNGPAAQCGLYVGTIRTAPDGTAEDSASRRYVWNKYNKVLRYMQVIETTNTWNYTTAAWRAANGNTANTLLFILGLEEDHVTAQVFGAALNATAGSSCSVAVGVNSYTTPVGLRGVSSLNGGQQTLTALYDGPPGLGVSSLSWLERSAAVGTTTWFGDNGGGDVQTGITGRLWA